MGRSTSTDSSHSHKTSRSSSSSVVRSGSGSKSTDSGSGSKSTDSGSDHKEKSRRSGKSSSSNKSDSNRSSDPGESSSSSSSNSDSGSGDHSKRGSHYTKKSSASNKNSSKSGSDVEGSSASSEKASHNTKKGSTGNQSSSNSGSNNSDNDTEECSEKGSTNTKGSISDSGTSATESTGFHSQHRSQSSSRSSSSSASKTLLDPSRKCQKCQKCQQYLPDPGKYQLPYIYETNIEHVMRHEYPTNVQTCSRCKFFRHQEAWKLRCSFTDPRTGVQLTWLYDTPDPRNRRWGVGCTLCTAAKTGSKFGRCGVTSMNSFDGQKLCRHGNNTQKQVEGIIQRTGEHDRALLEWKQKNGHVPQNKKLHCLHSGGLIPAATGGSTLGPGGSIPVGAGGTSLDKPTCVLREGADAAVMSGHHSAVLITLRQVKQRGSFAGLGGWMQTSRDAGAILPVVSKGDVKKLAHVMAQHERNITTDLIDCADCGSLGQDGAKDNLLITARMVLWKLPKSVDKKHLPSGVVEVCPGEGAPYTADRVLGIARCGSEAAARKGLRGDRSAAGIAEETAYCLKSISGKNYGDTRRIWRSYVSDNAKDEVNCRKELKATTCPDLDFGDQDKTHSFQIIMKQATKGVAFVDKV